MSIFGKKKEEKRPSLKIEDLPEFPDVPAEAPAYKPTLSDIKHEVSRPDLELDIPRRKSAVREKFKERVVSREERYHEPVRSPVSRPDGKPLFVKIEKYKTALTAIDVLKKKISEAESCLREIEDIRAKEDSKLNDWKADIQKLKERLLDIDQNLFEV